MPTLGPERGRAFDRCSYFLLSACATCSCTASVVAAGNGDGYVESSPMVSSSVSPHKVQLKVHDHRASSSLPSKPRPAHGSTPVMAWSSWYAWGGGSDLNETNVVKTAKLMVELGLVDAGYIYLNLDDAWLAPTRDRFGQLYGDPERFPSGIKALVGEVKAVDPRLKLGLYGDPGLRTCMGYPGQFEHEYQDAKTLAEWGVEFWKYDQCWHKFPLIDILALEAYSEGLPHTVSLSNNNALALNVRGMSNVGQDSDFAGIRIANFTGSADFVGPQINIEPARQQIQHYEAYRLFGEALAATGKNITYSICPFIAGCDKSIWSYYANVAHMSMNQCPEHDATDNWESFLWHVDDAIRNGVGEAARPGYFNDLDMLQIGYKELSDEGANHPLMSDEEYRTEYSIFCLLAAPLIFSNDLSRWNEAIAKTLLNREMIAIDQDPLGISGRIVTAYNSTNVPCKLPEYSPYLSHNLCVDQGELIRAMSILSLDGCAETCQAQRGCNFFGFSAVARYCELYSACHPRSTCSDGQACGYTTYKMDNRSASRRSAADQCWRPHGSTPNPNMLVVYARPLHDGSVAVGLMNRDGLSNQTISFPLSAINVPVGQMVRVRDMWLHRDQDGRLEENGASGNLTRVVCSHCTTVLKVSRIDAQPIAWKPWVQFMKADDDVVILDASFRTDDKAKRRRHTVRVPEFMSFMGVNVTAMHSWINLAWSATITSNSDHSLSRAATEYGLPGMLFMVEKGVFRRGTHNSTTNRRSPGGLAPGWQANVAAQMSTAAPWLKNQTIVGIQLCDECMQSGVPVRNMSAVAALIRSKLSEYGSTAWIHTNEGYLSFYPRDCLRLNGVSTDSCMSEHGVPPELDYISLDYYRVGAQEPLQAAEFYRRFVYPKMHSRQRTFVVPGLYGDASKSVESQEPALLEKLEGFWSWAKNDTNVNGMIPWHWNSWGSQRYKRGASEFPRLVARLREIGGQIKRQRSSSEDRLAK